MTRLLLIVILLMCVPALILCLIVLFCLPAWVRAFMAGAMVPLYKIVNMRIQRMPVDAIIDAHISMVATGLHVSIEKFEMHHLEGGNVARLSAAIVAAAAANLDYTFEQLAGMDLGGQNPLAFVKRKVGAR